MAFPLLAALIGAGASLGGAAISSRASRRAAEAQGETAAENRQMAEEATSESLSDFDRALQEAVTTLRGGGDRAEAFQRPFYDAGTAALSTYTDAMGLNGPAGNDNALSRFTASPGYQFQLGEGINALERSANARGRLYSGATMRDTLSYGQGLANQEWGNYLSRLTGLAGAGQQAGGTLSAMTGATSGSIADALLGTAANRANVRLGGLNAVTGANSDIGAARASGIVGGANSWNQGLTNLSQLIGYGAGQGFSTPLLSRLTKARNGNATPKNMAG